MEIKDFDTAIAYFESQSELSPFAAQVAKWLTERKDARRKSTRLRWRKNHNSLAASALTTE